MGKSQTVERKLFYAAAGWLSGIAVCAFAPVIIVIIAAAGAFALAAVLRFLGKPDKKTAGKLVIVALACLLSAVRVGCYEREVVRPLRALDGQLIQMRGIVTDVQEDSLTVRGMVQQNGVSTAITFRCNYNTGLSCGDEVRLTGSVRIPVSTPTFDREDYSRTNGVFLEGDGLPNIRLLQSGKDPFIRAVKHIRQRSVGNIRRRLPGQEGAFLTAILCSEKDALTAGTSSAIYRAGLGHLFAVSGTHVVMLCAFIGLLLSLIRFPVRLQSLLMTLFLVSFAVFSGCSPSVVRACIMMEMTQLGGFFNRQNDSANSLGLAAILITLRCPYAVGSLSFMLSFTAAFAFGTLAPAICRRRIEGSTARNAVAVMAVNTLTAPICAVSFSETSLIYAAANLLMIPFCSLCLTLCFLYLLTGCTVTPLLAAAGLAARLILKICGLITASRLGYVGTYYKQLMLAAAIIPAAVFLVCGVVRRHRRAVIIACCGAYAFLIFSLFAIDRLPKPDRLTVYPAQYGSTQVIEAGEEVIIFDSGGMASNAYAVARLTERRRPRKIYLYTLSDSDKAYDALTAQLTGLTDFCQCKDPEGKNMTGGSDKARFDDYRLVVTVNGCQMVFDKNEFTVNGTTYSYGGFYDISTIYLH